MKASDLDKLEGKIITLWDILVFGEKIFQDAKIYFGHGTDNAWDEAVFLAAHALKMVPNINSEVASRQLNLDEKKEILNLYKRRIEERIPAAYLINEAWFAGLSFYVDERVLIPRSPIAELIFYEFEPWVGDLNVKRILDIGTGSGCIAIACALAFPKAKVDAADISNDALEVAKINVEKYNLNERMRLIQSDVFNAIPTDVYDIIISNPPYVSTEEFKDLPKEYAHEPHLALAAGDVGLNIVKKIIDNAVSHLSPKGLLFVEVGDKKTELEIEYPRLPFLWLDFEFGEGDVFLLTKEQLLF